MLYVANFFFFLKKKKSCQTKDGQQDYIFHQYQWLLKIELLITKKISRGKQNIKRGKVTVAHENEMGSNLNCI